jgi:biotin-(acetyl-CoA carboxylase) ligase
VGQPIRVRLKEGDRDGIYGGIDASGALRLMSNGTERRVSAGDVFVI